MISVTEAIFSKKVSSFQSVVYTMTHHCKKLTHIEQERKVFYHAEFFNPTLTSGSHFLVSVILDSC